MMKFSDLIKLGRAPDGRVRREALDDLALPMPEDVLDQFVYDHGLNPDFQEQYGDLNLHCLRWDLEDLPAAQLILASAYAGFTRHRAIAALLQETRREEWPTVLRDPKALAAWFTLGTWLQPPVMLEGGLVGRDAALYLVEGHTRLGALMGLVSLGVIERASTHQVWVGRLVGSP